MISLATECSVFSLAMPDYHNYTLTKLLSVGSLLYSIYVHAQILLVSRQLC